MEHGWREDRCPHPLFDIAFYLQHHPQLLESGLNPVLHFLRIGGHTASDPHPLFDSVYYFERYIDIGEAGGKHTRLFVRGGFADVSAAGLIVLAETCIPVDQLSAERIGVEIKEAEEDLADATDEQKRLAQEKLDRLRELKDAMKI